MSVCDDVCHNSFTLTSVDFTYLCFVYFSGELVKHAAIRELHRLHHDCQIHHFKETDQDAHLSQWKVLKYAQEHVPYGINYFMKVHIG